MIYKPTDLSPSAQTFDVKDTPIFFECKVDTSNVRAVGYTIKILDSENNVVFSSIPCVEGEFKPLNIKYISLISDLNEYVSNKFSNYTKGYDLLNTGYNGTYLKFPFSVSYYDVAPSENTTRRSQIFYSETTPSGLSGEPSQSGLYRYDPDDGNIKSVGIYNGQEYKWAITLYQLQDMAPDSRNSSWDLPDNPLYYDMPLTTGTVLGSNNIRIQSVLSDEIYQDYFIQPAYIDGLKYSPEKPEAWTSSLDSITIDESRSNRVLIKSYDPTYGFIYPVTGEQGLLAETITPDPNNGSNVFRIYKRGNNTDNLTAYQQVVYVLGEGDALDNTVATKWDSTVSYLNGVVVSYNSVLYKSNKNVTTHDTPDQSNDWDRYYGQSWEWKDILANPGESYGIYTYYTNEDPNGVYIINGKSFTGNERTILNGQQTNAYRDGNGNYIGSPYNGIFYPQFSMISPKEYSTSMNYYSGDLVNYNNTVYECTGKVIGKDLSSSRYWTQIGTPTDISSISSYDSAEEYIADDIVKKTSSTDQTDVKYYQCTGVVYGEIPTGGSSYWGATSNEHSYKIVVNWLRTPDADTWGELKNKIVLVTNQASGDSYYGKNLQIKDINDNADAYGTINQTPFMFVPELPIEIYKNNYKYYDSEQVYSKGSIVRYIKSGAYKTYSDPATKYTLGDVVNNNSKFWICINVPESADDEPKESSKYWAEYKAQSYYIAVNDNITADTAPIGNTGSVNSNWSENPYLGNTGLIFYNNALGNSDPISSTSSTSGRLYIRHFDGLSEGMTLFENRTDNIQNYIKIKNWNSTYNYVTYDTLFEFNSYGKYVERENPKALSKDISWESANQTGQGTKYQIKTFFRESDENAFSFYTTPVVGIHYSNANGVDFVEDRKLTLKYYSDYQGNVPEYESGKAYSEGDVVKSSDQYYQAIKYNPIGGPTEGSWENVTNVWTNIDASTTTYNKHFNYLKDDIVEYNNKNDFLLYNSDYTYSYWDRVTTDGSNYYISIKNNNKGNNPASSSVYWEKVINGIDDIPSIKYIALTNIDSGINNAPSSKNIGRLWEQYIGVLFASDGVVNYVNYSANKIYEPKDIVLSDGLYYYVKAKNESITNDSSGIDSLIENSQGDQIWELETTVIDSDYYTYTNGYTTYGPKTSSFEGEAGKCYVYSSSSDSWSLYTKQTSSADPWIIEGVAYNVDSSTDLYTDFDKSQIYIQTASVYYEGLKYRVVAETSAHTLQDSSYFERGTNSEPFTYPRRGNLDAYSGIARRDFSMGDIVLGEGNVYVSGVSKTPLTPDRYYVKINNNSNDSNNDPLYEPKCGADNNWEIYYGQIYDNNGFPTQYSSSATYKRGDIIIYQGVRYKCKQDNVTGDFNNNDWYVFPLVYNETIYDESIGLYFIHKNIENRTVNSKYLQDYPPLKTADVFAPTKIYNEGDIALYNNTFYIYYNNTPQSGVRPDIKSSYWTLYPWQIFIPEITERTLVVSADYEQQQYVQWKSAQWFLLDSYNGDVLDQSAVFYDGDLSYTFHGLDGREKNNGQDTYYIVRLILETYNGYRLTIDETVETVFAITEIPAAGLISVSFDCDTASIVTTITKETGFIIPSKVGNAEVSYGNGDTSRNIGCMYLNGEMDYEKVAASIEDIAKIADAKYIESVAERFILQSSQKIDTDKLEGNIISLYSLAKKENNDNAEIVGAFNVYLGEMLKVDSNKKYSEDELLGEKEIIVLNEDKDVLWWKYKDTGEAGSKQDTEGPMKICDDLGEPLSAEGLIDANTLSGTNEYNYTTAPIIQRSGFNSAMYNRTNYLPLTYESVKINSSSDLNSDTYFNVAITYNNETLYGISSSIDSSDVSDDKMIKQIVGPNVQEKLYYFSSNDISKSSYDTRFQSVIFDPIGEGSTEIETSDDKTFVVHGTTSTHWSDYKFIVPAATFVGRNYANNSDVDYYTQKNVGTRYGWEWTDSSDEMWSDGDYITTYENNNSFLGSISLNGTVIEAHYFADNRNISIPKYSNTFFNKQIRVADSIKEREHLKDYQITFDIDLAMDADGYIYPTVDEFVSPEEYVKTNAYFAKSNQSNTNQ